SGAAGTLRTRLVPPSVSEGASIRIVCILERHAGVAHGWTSRSQSGCTSSGQEAPFSRLSPRPRMCGSQILFCAGGLRFAQNSIWLPHIRGRGDKRENGASYYFALGVYDSRGPLSVWNLLKQW